MILFIKANHGQTITVQDIELSDKFKKIKKKIHKRVGVPIYHMVLSFNQQIMSDNKMVGDYVTYPESVLHVDFDFDRFPEEEVYELDNFNKLYKSWKERNDNVTKVETQENEVVKLMFPEYNLRSLSYGPISIIFSFIDPLELILNFRSISKSYKEIVMELITKRVIELNKNHLYMMLGKKKFYISEKMFLKLASFESLWNDDTFYRTGMPKYRRSESSLLEFCVSHNYFKSLKYLIEKRGFRNLSAPDFQANILDFSLQRNKYIFEYLVSNRNLSGYTLSPEVFQTLLEKDDWENVRRLLSDEKNQERVCVFEGFLAAMDKNRSVARLSKWKEALSYFDPEEIDMNEILYRKCQFYIEHGFARMDWELILYFLHLRRGVQFEVTQSLSEREEFLPFILNVNPDDINLDFYLPRFQLMNASVIEGDKEKVRKILGKEEEEGLSSYVQEDDFHNESGVILRFPFLRIKDIEIVELLLPHMKIPMVTYIQSVEEGKYEFSDLFERFEHKFDRSFQVDREYYEVDLILTNLKKGPDRFENARNLLVKNKVVVWKKRRFCLSTEICEVLRISILRNAEGVISDVLSSLISKDDPHCYRQAFEILFKIISTPENDNYCPKKKSIHIFKEVLSKCKLDKKLGSRIFEMCDEGSLKEEEEIIDLLLSKKSWRNEYVCELMIDKNVEDNFSRFKVDEDKKRRTIGVLRSSSKVISDEEFLVCCYRGIQGDLLEEVGSSTCFVNILEEELCLYETVVKGDGEFEPVSIRWHDRKVLAAEILIPTEIVSLCRKCYDELLKESED